MYNINNPSNLSWSPAFAEVEKSVNETETYQQPSMIITSNENTLWKDLSKDQKEECYHLISQIL